MQIQNPLRHVLVNLARFTDEVRLCGVCVRVRVRVRVRACAGGKSRAHSPSSTSHYVGPAAPASGV